MHHVLVRSGLQDTFDVPTPPEDQVVPLAFDRPGDPHSVRSNIVDVMHDHSANIPGVAWDLMWLAAAVYSADTRVLRSTGYDRWTRAITLYLPVDRPDAWRPVAGDVEQMLSFLTGDHWEIRFRGRRSLPCTALSNQQTFLAPPSAVSLLSGGLDSFIGAIDRLENDEPLALVSHYGAGTTNRVQERTLALLERHYPGRPRPYSFYVLPPKLSNQVPERTTRSRSLLFLSLGTLVAASAGRSVPLMVPENGFISLNPALTLCRTGSASTRTTHPHFLSLFQRVLTSLGLGVEVDLPYRFLTKGQMAREVLNEDAFRDGVHLTVSCSHPEVGRFQGASPGQPCGYCVPCIIRRAALSAAGYDEPNRYLHDIRRGPPRGKLARRDLQAFATAVRRFDTAAGHRHLFDVLSTGPIPPEHAAEYVQVYRNGMEEVRSFLLARQPATS
jgi:7-cyano-7-deazaguanine synthase in queuosine biosynthesis